MKGNLAGSSTSAETELEVDTSLNKLTSHWGVISARYAGDLRRDWRRIAASQTAPANRENFCPPALHRACLARCWACPLAALARSALPAANRYRPTASQRRSSGPLPRAQKLQRLPRWGWRFAAHPTKAGTAGTENDWRAEPHAALASMLSQAVYRLFFNINQILLADSWRIGFSLLSEGTGSAAKLCCESPRSCDLEPLHKSRQAAPRALNVVLGASCHFVLLHHRGYIFLPLRRAFRLFPCSRFFLPPPLFLLSVDHSVSGGLAETGL